MAEGLVKVTVQGADTLSRTLQVAGRQLAASMTDANRDAGNLVAQDARGRAPRLTGALASSITVAPGPARAEITAGVRYAPFKEFGTRYQRPTYFLTGALGTTDVIDPYADAADEALRAVRGA